MGGRHDPKGAGLYGSNLYRREMRGLPVQHGAYVNVCGSDLVRNGTGNFVLLEDNLRVPSGVSYMLANRDVVRRAFPADFNSVYFEHAFIARQMGVELVEGRDRPVNDHVVYARTTSGLKRIDVIYRCLRACHRNCWNSCSNRT